MVFDLFLFYYLDVFILCIITQSFTIFTISTLINYSNRIYYFSFSIYVVFHDNIYHDMMKFKLNQSTFSMLSKCMHDRVTHWGFKIYAQVLKSNYYISYGPCIRVTHRVPYILRHCRLY